MRPWLSRSRGSPQRTAFQQTLDEYCTARRALRAIASAKAEGAIAPSHIRLQPPARSGAWLPPALKAQRTFAGTTPRSRPHADRPRRAGDGRRDGAALVRQLADLLRRAATGVKPLNQIGFDLTAFSATLLRAAAGGHVDRRRARDGRPQRRALRPRPRRATWAIAAPLAQLAKLALYGGTLGYFRPDDAITDIVCTLGLQLGLGFLEEENLV